MKAFLRDDLGCHALISNANSWTRFTTDQGGAHRLRLCGRPFLRRSPAVPRRLVAVAQPLSQHQPDRRRRHRRPQPRRSRASSTGRSPSPNTITPAPGRFRGVGGILTGALGRLAGLGWHLAVRLQPQPRGHVHPVAHELLRHGVRPAQPGGRTRLALPLPPRRSPARAPPRRRGHDRGRPGATRRRRIPTPRPPLALARLGHPHRHPGRALARRPSPTTWSCRSAGRRPRSGCPAAKALAVDPYSSTTPSSGRAVRDRGSWPTGNLTDPARKVYQSETGEV